MKKTLSHAIMHRSKFKNNFNKNHNEENKRLYKTEKLLCFFIGKRKKKRITII